MILILLIIFALLSLYYFYFLLKIYNGLNKISTSSLNDVEDHFISIIIPFRNEAQNILNSISSVEGLNYPRDKYEVIYVDDNSTDDSFSLADSGKKMSNIKLYRLTGEVPGKGNKKYALQYGIGKSQGDIIVTTDADCIHPQNWLNHIAGCFDSVTAFVSGPVEFIETKGLFPRVQSTEFAGLILAGAGLIGAGRPIICNGANIAYRREVFNNLGGLKDNLNIASGDDEYLMQKIARETNYKIRFCPSREAVVHTDPNRSIGSFLNQRRRWASKSFFYKDAGLTTTLVLIFLFYAGLIAQTVLLISGYFYFAFTLLGGLLIKILMELLIIKRGERLFLSKKNIRVFLITEFLQVPYIIIASIAGLVGGFTWKGRNIRR